MDEHLEGPDAQADRRAFLKRMAALAFAAPVVSSFVLESAAYAGPSTQHGQNQTNKPCPPNQHGQNQTGQPEPVPGQYGQNQTKKPCPPPNQYGRNQTKINKYPRPG